MGIAAAGTPTAISPPELRERHARQQNGANRGENHESIQFSCKSSQHGSSFPHTNQSQRGRGSDWADHFLPSASAIAFSASGAMTAYPASFGSRPSAVS